MERRPQQVRDRRGTNFLPACAVVFGATLIVESALGINLNFIAVLLGFAFALFASRGVGWAWIPAIFFLSGPALEVIAGVFGMRTVPDVSIPLLLMVAGGVLVFREHFPPGMARVTLVALLILGVISIGDGPNPNPNVKINIKRQPTTTGAHVSQTMPELNGRTLEINAHVRNVELTEGTTSGTQNLPNGTVAVVTKDTVQIVATDDLDLFIPKDADVSVRSISGNITIESATADVEIDSVSGSVDVTVHADPSVVLTTQSGDIDLDGYEGDDDPKGSFRFEGPGPKISVTTVSGNIDLTRDFDPKTTTTAKPR